MGRSRNKPKGKKGKQAKTTDSVEPASPGPDNYSVATNPPSPSSQIVASSLSSQNVEGSKTVLNALNSCETGIPPCTPPTAQDSRHDAPTKIASSSSPQLEMTPQIVLHAPQEADYYQDLHTVQPVSSSLPSSAGETLCFYSANSSSSTSSALAVPSAVSAATAALEPLLHSECPNPATASDIDTSTVIPIVNGRQIMMIRRSDGRRSTMRQGRKFFGFPLGPSPVAPILVGCCTFVVGAAVTAQVLLWKPPHAFFIPFVLPAFAIGSLISLIAVVISDPGIISETENGPPVPPEQDIMCDFNGVSLTMRWCSRCRIHRSPRASHCKKCGVCVDRRDHHCQLVSNCIGLRNIGRFLLFLLLITATTSAAAYGSIAVILQALESEMTAEEILIRRPISSVLALVNTITAAGLVALLVDTCLVVSRNETRVERYRQVFADGNPFDSGFINNWSSALLQGDETPKVVIV